jgi:hypothetical protein
MLMMAKENSFHYCRDLNIPNIKRNQIVYMDNEFDMLRHKYFIFSFFWYL